MYDFQKFETIRSLGDSIYTGKISMDEAEMDQPNLLENMVKLDNKSRPRSKEDKDKKRNTFDSVNALYKGLEFTVNTFRSEIFPIKSTQGIGRPRMLALHPWDLVRVVKVSDGKVS